MAKGRRQASSRSERFLGSYGYANSTSAASGDASELEEDEVWSVDFATASSHSSIAQKTFRRERRLVGGLSLAFDESGSPEVITTPNNLAGQTPPTSRQVAASAPVNVPDWSKIRHVKAAELFTDAEDDDSEMVPPHVYLAREYERSRKMCGSSVFEGVGRTLKGRDLWRVRDAVWRQTGFDG